MKELTSLKSDLADYFCENAEKFKLEELLQTLATFCEQLQKAIKVGSQKCTVNLRNIVVMVLLKCFAVRFGEVICYFKIRQILSH